MTQHDFPDLPEFLRIPAAERAQAWRDNPPRNTTGTGPRRRKPCWWDSLWPESWLDDPAQMKELHRARAEREQRKADRLAALRARRGQ